MKCTRCGHLQSKVLESRDLEEGRSIRRRRECINCGLRFTTYERLERPNLLVAKKSGVREGYQRAKLAGGIYRSLEKRPLKAAEIENIISSIETELYQSAESEIPSSKIGELVMAKLIAVDDVAYVRFASVYRSFADLGSFQRELDKLNDIKHQG